MIRLSDEDLENPVILNRYAALVGLSPEAFRSRFLSVGSSELDRLSKGGAT
jgi:hypothetical protein